MVSPLAIRFRLEADGPEIVVQGRDAWCLWHLHRSGAKGCTPIENVGPRWSAYVHNLRKLGLNIETVYEQHGGPYRGNHARYVLHSTIEILKVREHGQAA